MSQTADDASRGWHCMLSDLEGELMELNLMPNIVVKALRLQEGNHIINSMKLNQGD